MKNYLIEKKEQLERLIFIPNSFIVLEEKVIVFNDVLTSYYNRIFQKTDEDYQDNIFKALNAISAWLDDCELVDDEEENEDGITTQTQLRNLKEILENLVI